MIIVSRRKKKRKNVKEREREKVCIISMCSWQDQGFFFIFLGSSISSRILRNVKLLWI